MAEPTAAPGDPAPSTEPTAEVEPEPQVGDAGKKAIEEERKARREAEKQLKALNAELEQFRQQSMTDAEKAIEAARQEARAQALAEVGSKVAAAEIRAAASGRLEADQLDLLLENLNVSRFIGEDGEVDREAVSRFVDGIAPKASLAPRGALDQGARTSMPLNGDPVENALRAAVGA
jgi:flagellar biosynthesis GTPase FlhF